MRCKLLQYRKQYDALGLDKEGESLYFTIFAQWRRRLRQIEGLRINEFPSGIYCDKEMIIDGFKAEGIVFTDIVIPKKKWYQFKYDEFGLKLIEGLKLLKAGKDD